MVSTKCLWARRRQHARGRKNEYFALTAVKTMTGQWIVVLTSEFFHRTPRILAYTSCEKGAVEWSGLHTTPQVRDQTSTIRSTEGSTPAS
ncbi:hypothetical protein M3J09_002251 [Ascochyta lentis]